jgi:hypothetical protein
MSVVGICPDCGKGGLRERRYRSIHDGEWIAFECLRCDGCGLEQFRHDEQQAEMDRRATAVRDARDAELNRRFPTVDVAGEPIFQSEWNAVLAVARLGGWSSSADDVAGVARGIEGALRGSVWADLAPLSPAIPYNLLPAHPEQPEDGVLEGHRYSAQEWRDRLTYLVRRFSEGRGRG